MNINQILNSALLNEGDNDEVSNTLDNDKKYHAQAGEFGEVSKDDKKYRAQAGEFGEATKVKPSTALDDTLNWAKTNPGTTTAATLAALGAGLGAVALAKKLRAKKAQAKK